MSAIGEVKIPGGKLVRVTVADAAGTRTCHIDGDFFAAGEQASAAAITQAEAVLAARLDALDAPGTAIEPWYRATVRALEPIVGSTLIGANAEAIALAALRAHAQRAPEAFAPELARFEAERSARIRRQWQAAQHDERTQPPLIDPRSVRERWRAFAPVLVEDGPRMPEE